jgi:hypothetical protein
MLAYHNKQSVKDHYLAAAEFHAWTDQYQQGVYFDPKNLRGCAVGCWTHDPMGGHAALEAEMGIPEELLRLADQLFESLPEGEYQRWPYRFAAAIVPGADLGGVRARFLQWLLFDKTWGLSTLARLGDVGPVLRDMKAYFDWQAEGLEPSTPLEAQLQVSVAELIEKFKDWHQWDEYAKPETRASRALIKVWEARHGGQRSLAEAAWSCRAAWAAQEAFTAAMTEATLRMLAKAPVMVAKAGALPAKRAAARPAKKAGVVVKSAGHPASRRAKA